MPCQSLPYSKSHRIYQFAVLTTLVVCAMVSVFWVEGARQDKRDERRLEASNEALNQTNLLQAQLRNFASAARTLAIFARNSDDIEGGFEQLAGDMLEAYPKALNLALSPDGVVRMVMPKEPNQAVLGFDQLNDERKGSEERRILARGQLGVDGPMELIQGGEGLVTYYTVYRPDELGKEQFWGFANGVIRLEDLLDTKALERLDAQGYHYRLWRTHPVSGERQTISQNTLKPLSEPVNQVIPFADNPWTLSMVPKEGWVSGLWLGFVITLAALISALLVYLVKTLWELRWHKQHLEWQVAERTKEVTTNLDRYRSLIAASNTGAWEYFHGQGYLACSPEYFSMLGRNIADYEHLGRTNLNEAWVQLMHPDDRERAARCFEQYIEQGAQGLYEQRFRLKHKDGHWVWVLSRGQSLRDDQGQLRGVTVGTHIDITQQVEAEERLTLAAKVFEMGGEGILITDPQQRILMVNRAFTQITGFSEQEALGQTPRILSSDQHDSAFYRVMWEEISRRGVWQGEVWNRRKDGTTYPQWLTISEVCDELGQVSHYIGIISDISRLKEDQEEIHRLAYYDPLTQLPNRLLLEERADFALRLAQRSGQSVALLFLDLDNFKNINDSLGHKAGDRLLQSFAERLDALVREEDTFARQGGDEFILLLPNTDANGAAHTAQKLLTMLKRPFRIDGYNLSVSSSIGIALYPEDGSALNQLYTHADIAMYRAKQKGRDTYSFFTPELQTHYVRLMKVENAMREALEQGQFSLHYQPQQEITSGALVGLEALLRWRHPELGQISPAEFIPVAESSGLIISLGDWVLSEATRQLRAWIDAGIAPPKIAVNLSAAQFRQTELPDRVLVALEQSQLPAEYLELELTESMTMEDPEKAITTINRLHHQGISLSIDDFGTGYSSLNYLKRFKINKLKIDQAFVRDLDTDNDDRVIVSTIITLAKSLGLRSIAEGVETREQLDFLRELGCNDIQGYYLSPPMAAQDAELFLRRAHEMA